MKGRVKWWNSEYGYGFIECKDDEEIFVYLEKEDKTIYHLKENEEIEFTLHQKTNGLFLKILKAE